MEGKINAVRVVSVVTRGFLLPTPPIVFGSNVSPTSYESSVGSVRRINIVSLRIVSIVSTVSKGLKVGWPDDGGKYR